jgi:hypothetical protein
VRRSKGHLYHPKSQGPNNYVPTLGTRAAAHPLKYRGTWGEFHLKPPRGPLRRYPETRSGSKKFPLPVYPPTSSMRDLRGECFRARFAVLMSVFN